MPKLGPARGPIIIFPDKRINVDLKQQLQVTVVQPVIFTGQEKLDLTLKLSSLGAVVKV